MSRWSRERAAHDEYRRNRGGSEWWRVRERGDSGYSDGARRTGTLGLVPTFIIRNSIRESAGAGGDTEESD
ncbi:hypothetical protein HYPSUDRAFT_49509 [Hypholoma sublateritium FD-334 SS-4]|uniref:Uncharacterized protein n=1 Tax=Hypholoma sublateritium (strain FD-334 SS-4) TaxID=945553 RepID=A0A0D2KH64_HYPSF|nr:hypothetical protein HYPSUDRAFT_49509 [Hypholoma sublateritium FD-334 SS-4]